MLCLNRIQKSLFITDVSDKQGSFMCKKMYIDLIIIFTVQKMNKARRDDMATVTKKGKNIQKPVTYNFPDPDANDEGMDEGVDAVFYLHKAAEYERWTERAKSCGREDLVILYEMAAERWFNLYKVMEKG